MGHFGLKQSLGFNKIVDGFRLNKIDSAPQKRPRFQSPEGKAKGWPRKSCG